MPESNKIGTILQPNPYAGGRVPPPIIMPTELQNTGGNAPGNQGSGQNSLIIDDDVSLSGPSTGLNGTPQTNPPYQGGNVQPTAPGTDFINTVPGMMPGPGQLPSDNRFGWRQQGNDWYYFDPDSGALVKGWKEINNFWYYLDPATGIMATGWIKTGGLWYYLDPKDGHMLIDWNYIGGEWFYLETDNRNGQMVTGWKLHKGNWYFLFENGAMAHGGWVKVDEKWYCFRDHSGEMETSKIIPYKGKNYYVGEDGAMVVNTTGSQLTVSYNGVTYEVDEEGVCTAIRNELADKIEQWMVSVQSIGTWYTQNISTYLAGETAGTRAYTYCALIDKKVGDDCSSMVSACLVLYGIENSVGYSSYSFNKLQSQFSNTLGQNLTNAGFVWHSYTQDYIPQRGDISVQHKTYMVDGEQKTAHHVEVIDSYDENAKVTYVWSWGDVYNSLPIPRSNWRVRTSGYWRIEQ